MGRLEIYTLGGVRFLENGETVDDLSTRKVEALAVYLASNKRPQPREALADLLWDDRSQTRAMSNLRVALSNLRKHLGSYFTINRNDASLNLAETVWLDTAEIEALLTAEQSKIGQIEAGIELYQGEFLQGFSVSDARLFDEWVSVERERLHHLVLKGLSQVVEWHLTRGDYAAGIQQATRWLQLDPLSEAAYQSMMRLLTYNGQAGSAIRQYQECVKVLDEEMGLMPSAETTELYEAIQAGTLAPPERPELGLVGPEQERPPEVGKSPFKGLSYYDVDDAHLFFGREALTAQLAGLLKEGRFLAVVGASGSGKSSLVRAGLLPALKRTRPLADGSNPPKGSEKWPVYLITPTARPLKALALSLTRKAESTRTTTRLMDDLACEPRSLDIYAEKLLSNSLANRLLLVIDQFEELFTLCRVETERQTFIDNLLTAATNNPSAAVTIVLTLRADFYAYCARYDGLRELLQNHQVYIGQMSNEELWKAIEGPATSGGWTFEPGLVDLLLHDIGAGRNRKPEPGALPLLSHALQETWRRRRGREMTFSSYVETGGVRQAIAKTAETVYNQDLTAQQQPIARSIFLRLTEWGEGTQVTRRRATQAELVSRKDEVEVVETVLKKLADARLVTTRKDGVEVAHEALIREWPRLTEWLAEDREGLRVLRQLTEAALAWQALDKDEGALYRGTRLAQVEEWVDKNGRDLNILEREFVEASLALARQEEADREAQRQRELTAARELAAAERTRAEVQTRAAEQLARGRRRLLGALLAASILAIAAVFFGLRFRQNLLEVERQIRIAFARELAGTATAIFETDPELGQLLAIEAVNSTLRPDGFPTNEAERALYNALSLPLQKVLRGHTSSVNRARFSPDGQHILTVSRDGTARLWDGDGRLVAILEGHTGAILNGVFSPNSNRLVTTSLDGTARLWDREGNFITALEGHTAQVNWAVFSPDGEYILTSSNDSTARLWDADGRFITTLEGHTDVVSDGYFSPDGKRILTASFDGAARLWDANGNLVTTLEGHNGPIYWSIFSLDGSRIVTASQDNTARLWDADGHFINSLEGHTYSVRSAVFSPDGEYILTASADGTARLWDQDGNTVLKLEGHTATVNRARFSPDGLRIVTASFDGTARLWDVQGNLLLILEGHEDNVIDINFSPDGRRILTASEDGTARLWGRAGSLPLTLQGHNGQIQQVSIHPNSDRILTSGVDGTARLWDSDGQLLHTLEGHQRTVYSAVFSPDGTQILTASDDGAARLWDGDGNLTAVLDGHTAPVWSAGFNSAGDRIVTTSDDGTAILWDVNGSRLATLSGHLGPVQLAVFNPAGTRLVTAGFDGTPRLWDVAVLGTNPEEALLTRLTGHVGPIRSVTFSQDGRYIVTGGDDGKAILWDANGDLLITYKGHTGPVHSVSFNSESNHILTASEDNTARLWNVPATSAKDEDNDGDLIKILTGHTDAVHWAGFSSDGRRIATISLDGTTRLWGAEGNLLALLEEDNSPITAASFSPDGSFLVTVSDDGRLFLWRVWSSIEAMLSEAERRVSRTFTEAECQLYLHQEKCP